MAKIWRVIVKISAIGLTLLICLTLLIALDILYSNLHSKYNYNTIKNSLKNADEACVVTSYAVSTKDGNSFVRIDGRNIPIQRWSVNNSDDGVFIVILLKDGKPIQSLNLIRTEAELVLDGQLDGCKNLKH